MRTQTALRITTALAALFIMGFPQAASAGGGWFESDQERYEPGDVVTLTGYTGGGAYGWIEDGPFFGFLFGADGYQLPVGEIVLEDNGGDGYMRLRAVTTFALPADLEPGE